MEADAGPAFDFSHLPTDALHVVFEHVFAPIDPRQQPALPLSLFWERWAACSAVCKTWREVSAVHSCAETVHWCVAASEASVTRSALLACVAPVHWRAAVRTQSLLPHSILRMTGAARAPAALLPSCVGSTPSLAALAVVAAAACAVHPGGRGCGEHEFCWRGWELLQGALQ